VNEDSSIAAKRSPQSDRILFVDDEPILLDTMRRLLEHEFSIVTAPGGLEGLAAIREQGPFAVAVSDMHMPGMDGNAFLSKVRDLAPDTVRLLFTGFGDITTAVKAVNEGRIFRFVEKPCQYEQLTLTLRASLEQNRLIRAERELLESTLADTVQALVESLAVVRPCAFGRAVRVRACMAHLAGELGLPASWQFELAGLLSTIGCVAVPPDILERRWAEQPLTEAEIRVFSSHPETARKLLQRIPRLENVAEIVGAQLDPPVPLAIEGSPAEADVAALGTAMLRVSLALDQRLGRGEALSSAIAALRGQPDLYPPLMLQAMLRCDLAHGVGAAEPLCVPAVSPGAPLQAA
jgi:response regulator RpfG family c-di-GMP phosphodiesterase